MAAAVVFDDVSPAMARRLHGVADSKTLTHQQRVELDEVVRRRALAIGIGSVSQQVIDQVNILNATKLAMAQAVGQLATAPDHLLIDALRLGDVDLPQTPVIRGDALCLSIAAASIVAKVYRDRLMADLHQHYPAYCFASNKGYGTMAHFRALHRHGLLPLHRRGFIPMRLILENDQAALTSYRKMIRLLAEAELPDRLPETEVGLSEAEVDL